MVRTGKAQKIHHVKAEFYNKNSNNDEILIKRSIYQCVPELGALYKKEKKRRKKARTVQQQ